MAPTQCFPSGKRLLLVLALPEVGRKCNEMKVKATYTGCPNKSDPFLN